MCETQDPFGTEAHTVFFENIHIVYNENSVQGDAATVKTRKTGSGRRKSKPEYDAGKNLKEQMERAAALYDSDLSLQAIADELGLNPIKIRKLLITAGVYESDTADRV